MKKILVIGSGVIGQCAAFYLAQRGDCQVTVLDRVAADHEGCSYRNAGMIVPSHFIPLAAPGMVSLALKWMWNPASPFYIKPRFDRDLFSWGWKFWKAANAGHVRRAGPLLRDLHLASRACFEELAEEGQNRIGLVRNGLLMLCKTQHALDEEAAAAEQARQMGIPAEALSRADAARKDPNVTMDVAGAVYFPKDCRLDPTRFMEELRNRLDKLGVQFVWSAEVTDWRTSHGKIEAVKTSIGEIASDEIVLCGGSWSPALAHGLGLRIPIQPGKGYSLTLSNPRQLPQICSILTEARVAVTPMGSSLRFGGTMEMAGLDESINPVRVQGIVNAVPKYYPEFKPTDFERVAPWRGLRPCSPDGLPYLGRTAAYSNLIVATGHAMLGLSLGPITGKLVAQIAAGEKPSFDLTLLNPDRYASRF